MSALTDDIDIKLEDIFNQIKVSQDTYFKNNNTYCQLCKTHTVIPKDGEKAIPDKESQKIGQAKASWDDLEQLPNDMESCLEIHNYGNSKENGYIIIIKTMEKDKILKKIINVGPQTWRNQEWGEEITQIH